MIVGSLRVRLLLREARSLKDKRQVVQSIKDRLRNGFNVSVAEVEAQDNRQLAVLGLAMVGNEAQPRADDPANRSSRPCASHPVAELLDHEMESIGTTLCRTAVEQRHESTPTGPRGRGRSAKWPARRSCSSCAIRASRA